ncbi:MAG: hypothetical protein J6T16_05545 [Opitutales bacterium]|nr:hypothetical protein [Opitutales bacterium]
MKTLIKDVLGAYSAGMAEYAQIKADTVRQNCNALLRIAGSENLPLEKLNFERLSKWRRAQYSKWNLKPFSSPQKNYVLNSDLGKAKSVFCAKAMELYQMREIAIPQQLRTFLNAAPLKPAMKPHFVAIKKEIDEQIKRDCEGVLSGASVRGLDILGAVMILLARKCGMTNSEIHHFDLDWIGSDADGFFIDICEREAAGKNQAFATKRGKKNRQIAISKNTLRMLQAALQGRCAPYFGEYDAHKNIGSEYRKCCKYLAQYLSCPKKLHELRKMACSDVLARDRDIYAAANFIGDSVKTTMEFYSALLNRTKELD